MLCKIEISPRYIIQSCGHDNANNFAEDTTALRNTAIRKFMTQRYIWLTVFCLGRFAGRGALPLFGDALPFLKS